MSQPIKYSLTRKTLGNPNVSIENNRYIFYYPCKSSSECANYELNLNKGTYLVELYGASRGYTSNRVTLYRTSKGVCTSLPQKSLIKTNIGYPNIDSAAESGRYTSGVITLYSTTKAYLAIDGKGTYGYVKKIEKKSRLF